MAYSLSPVALSQVKADNHIMNVASIPDLSLAECLEIVGKYFDIEALSERES